MSDDQVMQNRESDLDLDDDISQSPSLAATSPAATEDPQQRKGSVSSSRELKKVRTGCLTCKIRKVKCDETKPVCLRCANSDRVCQGYPDIPPRAKRSRPKRFSTWLWMATSGHDGPGAGSALRDDPDDREDLSPSLLLSPTEAKSALVIFRCRTAPRLVTFMDKHFWTELVLQIGNAEPAVLHALTAVNIFYDYFESGAFDQPVPLKKRLGDARFADGLAASNRAIAELLERPSHLQYDSETVHLICCIIFICIEMLCTDHWAAYTHFERGVQLLELHLAAQNSHLISPPHRAMAQETLVPIFRRMSLHATLIGKSNPVIQRLTSLTPINEGAFGNTYPDLHVASRALVAVMEEGLRMVNDLVALNQLDSGALAEFDSDPEVMQYFSVRNKANLTRLRNWLLRFSPLQVSIMASPTADPQEKLCCHILHASQMASEMWESLVMQPLECPYDQFLDRFATIVHLATNSLALERQLAERLAKPVFTFEIGMLAPLWFTAWRCRQRQVRLAALDLVRRWPRKENFWIPAACHRALRIVVQTEDPDALDADNGSLADYWPPEADRVCKAFMHTESVDDDSTTYVTMHRKSNGPDEDWEIIRRVVQD